MLNFIKNKQTYKKYTFPSENEYYYLIKELLVFKKYIVKSLYNKNSNTCVSV